METKLQYHLKSLNSDLNEFEKNLTAGQLNVGGEKKDESNTQIALLEAWSSI